MSRSLGVDFGTKRVGLAVSDPLGMTARPLSVVSRSSVVDEVVGLVKELDIGTIVVGLPTGLGGDEGASASEARNLAEELGTATGVDLVLLDERFTSRMAESALLESGMKRRERRETVDKVAAAIILQDYLDKQR
ncbi:MAG: Holliday junction resolvase RuvX [Acidimicrobiia bacterium]